MPGIVDLHEPGTFQVIAARTLIIISSPVNEKRGVLTAIMCRIVLPAGFHSLTTTDVPHLRQRKYFSPGGIHVGDPKIQNRVTANVIYPLIGICVFVLKRRRRDSPAIRSCGNSGVGG